MIVITAGLHKTGSTYWNRLVNDLLAHHGGSDTSEVVDAFHLRRLLKRNDRAIRKLSATRLVPALIAAQFRGPFVLKTHDVPKRTFRLAQRLGLVCATFNVRDPRDIVVSAADHGARQREAGMPLGDFARRRTIDDHIDFFARDIPGKVEGWLDRPDVSIIRYEQLIKDPVPDLMNVARMAGVAVTEQEAQAVVDRVHPSRLEPHGEDNFSATKFNVGGSGRYRAIMTTPELNRANAVFRHVAHRLNYPLEETDSGRANHLT